MQTLFSGKAFRFEKDTFGVGVVTFDLEGERVNKLSHVPASEFDQILDLVSNSGVKSLLIRSAKKQSFIVGADITLIQKLKDQENATQASAQGQLLFSKLEDLNIPTLAAIEGPCMGGGTELILACRYRVCSDHAKTAIALPEVKLGVLPGWGGSWRLPKLVGLPNALDMMLTGKSVYPSKAEKIKLVDLVLPQELFEEKAYEIAKILAEGKPFPNSFKKKKSGLDIPELLSTNFIGRKIIFRQAHQGVMKQTRGHYPAPIKILQLIEKTYGVSREKSMGHEARAFGDLWNTPESKNLVNLFFLVENSKKDTGTKLSDQEIKNLSPVSELGVLGAGVMGGGIAAESANHGIRVVLKDLNHEALGKAFAHARSVLDKLVKKRRLKPAERDQKIGKIRGQLDYTGFASLDLVIEAIVENLEIKKKTFAELETKVSPQTIIASNTSSLRLEDMASSMKDSSRFVGIHFFNPVEKMPLIEVIAHKKSSDQAIAKAVLYSRAIGKTPVVVRDGPGFLVNRLLMPWLNEAGYMLQEGYRIETLDRIAKKFGMPMGPCELLDEIGIDVAAKVGHILESAFGERAKAASASDLIAADKSTGTPRLGRKSGLGFYRWDKPAGRRLEADSVAIEKIVFADAKVPNEPEHSYESVVKRMFYPMINEATLAIEEGIVDRVEQVDLAMIFGTGFPPFRGGLCRWADSIGLNKVQAELERLSEAHGLRLKPTTALMKMAATDSSKFYL